MKEGRAWFIHICRSVSSPCIRSKPQQENWDRFLPQFKKKNVQRRKPHAVKEKKAYTPFPPLQQPSKVDMQLESGEYFLNEHQRKLKKKQEKMAM